MGDSKPIEIGDNYQSLNCEQNSLSAYASAESSPCQTNGIIADHRLIDEPDFPKSDTSCSINTYWGLPAATSLLIDEEDKLDALEHSREKLSQSKSFNDAKFEEINKINTDKDYQSLPANITNNDIHYLQTLQTNITLEEKNERKRELLESDLFKLNIVEDEEDLVKVDLKEDASLKNDQLPEMSKPKSTTMSFIEKIFSSSSSSSTKTTETPFVQKEEVEVKKSIVTEETQVKAAPTLTATLTSAAISASSPNPECSPYKFLINEYPTKTTDVKVNSFKMDTKVTQETTGKTNEIIDDKVIESLASLDHKDSETHDPILSGAKKIGTKPVSSKKESTETKPAKPTKTASKTSTKSNKSPKSVSNLPLADTKSSKVDHLPASSREFTMDLNFKLGSAAAATAGGPIVVVDNSNKSPVTNEHNKFTSNASTSSIHNDLKMILEESKDNKKASGKENKKLNKSKDKPKPQRTKKDHNKSKDTSNTSFNSTTETSSSMTVETGNLSPISKTNDLNLIKMMMLMVENNKNGKPINKQMQLERTEEPSLIELAKQDGRYKYKKEFLMQIREKRAAFIDQIHPDIFKAYCYCMNGKYWDPEKYFDIISFPGDYDRIPSGRNNYNRSSSYNKTNSKYNKKNTPNSTFNNSGYYNSKNMSFGTTPTAVQNLQEESPQPLQVPKNSPKFDTKDNKNEKSVQSIFETLGINTEHMKKTDLDADKILLGIIKKNKNFDESSRMKKTQQPSNILDNLLRPEDVEKKLTSQQKHYPLILTAQELEMSQLNQEKLTKCKLPNEISMTKLEDLQQSMESNDSFAYKQLVRNLNNHPLTSTTSLSNKLEASLAKLQTKQNLEKSKPSWQVSNDGTNMLKQLLNLKTEVKSEKAKKYSKKHHSSKYSHLSMSHGSETSSSTGSSPIDNGLKFPTAIPTEKPFETYAAEENRKQIEHVVASALNQVLNKSPISNGMKHLQSPKSPIDELIEKIDNQHKEQDLKNTQHQHFNSLLNKMNNQQAQMKQETNQSDILKWFSETNKSNMMMPANKSKMSAQFLSEIELMQMHRPTSALDKLF